MKRLLWLLAVSMACAHGATPGGLPDALHGVKQATGMCARPDLPAATAEQRRLVATAPGAGAVSCGIGVRELVALGTREPVTLIDVRDANARARGTIDGSLGMSAGELRHKAFLRERTVVLVGGGKGQGELLAACATLKSEGFAKPLVLLGGVPAWVAERQPVVGSGATNDEVPRLTTEELWMESRFEPNLLFVAESLRPIREQLSNAYLVPELTPSVLKRALDRVRPKRPASIASVVLVSDAELSIEQVRALREALRPTPLLAWSGTAEGFVKDMRRQSAIWTAHARGPKQPGCGL